MKKIILFLTLITFLPASITQAGPRFQDSDDDNHPLTHGPFVQAIKQNNIAGINELLQQNTDLEIEDSIYGTALYQAAQDSNPEIIQLLINAGANIHTTSKKSTPMHNAVRSGKIENIVTLMKAGAKIDEKDRNNNTPIMTYWELSNQYSIIFYMLLDAGINPHQHDLIGNTLLHRTMVRNDRNMAIELISAKQVSINPINNLGWTPLHTAAYYNASEAAKSLIYADANLHAMTNKEETPLDVAYQRNNFEMVELLLWAQVHENGIKKGDNNVLKFLRQ